MFNIGSRDTVVGIAIHYGLEASGIESRWVEIFRSRPDRPWGQPSPLYSGHQVSFPGVNRPGPGVEHPTPYRAEVKEKIELYLYYPSGPSWPLMG